MNWLRGVLSAVFAVLLMNATSLVAQEAKLSEAKPVPELNMEGMDGTPVDLADYRGEVLVLNFFATWCAPCRAEMPSLDRLQAKMGTLPVRVVALAVDRAGPEKIQQWMDELGVEHLTILRDPSLSALKTMRALGLPATFVIDSEGRERERVYGIEEWDSEEIVGRLKSLLADSA